MSAASTIVVLCTGNAARSVMAATMLRRDRPDLRVIGAGTHAIEGLPMSNRTREAMDVHGGAETDHRSHQLVDADLDGADLIVGFSPDHVAYVRRVHPTAADRAATLHHLAATLGEPDSGPLRDRVAELRLAEVALAGSAEVVDPAGGDEATFAACAAEIRTLLDVVGPRL